MLMWIFFWIFAVSMAGCGAACVYLLWTVGPCFTEPNHSDQQSQS